MKENNTPHLSPNTPFTLTFISKTLLVIVIILLLLIIGGTLYFFGMTSKKVNINSGKVQQPQVQPENSQVSTIPKQPAALFSGQLTKLDKNLKIFKITETDKLNGTEENFVYYSAGKFNQGELKDYTRIIAVRPSEGPGQPLVFTLATKDFQSFILDDPDNNTTKYPPDDWQNPYNFLDKSLIISAAKFDTEQPKELNLDQIFSLYREDFPIENVPTGKKDENGNQFYKIQLAADFFSYQKLASPFNNLNIYSKPFDQNTSNYGQLNQDEKEKIQMKQKYILGDTEVIVIDSAGLPVTYAMTTQNNIKQYQEQKTRYDDDYKKYQDQLKKYQNKEISQYPQVPDYVALPNLGFTDSQIHNQSNLNFFKTYETAIPGACSFSQNTRVVNLSDGDLEQIGVVSDMPLYKLKDANHPIYTLAYNNKFDYFKQDLETWNQVNKGISKLTLSEYVNQNPLLFIKDYWNRWVVFGEYDIKLPGGCGKPVIYLYPAKPADVRVEFRVPVQLTVDIPRYAGYWQVKAYPDGTLVNLKPEFTDCHKLDIKQTGSEYAQNACQTNTYPYLYWSGNITSGNYPVVRDGWIIEKNDIGNFFEEKLTVMGLNSKERKDFTDYWISELLNRNSPYYRISFLQTNDLNTLFPMTVTPKPDTVFRLFLDYTPLTEKPDKLPQPQILNRLIRHGFTLVEWGGIKQP